jgi:hypothetical protein
LSIMSTISPIAGTLWNIVFKDIDFIKKFHL